MAKATTSRRAKGPVAEKKTTLAEFLVNLSENARNLRAFEKDAEAVLAKSNLGAADRKLILAGDPVKLRAALVRQGAFPTKVVGKGPGPIGLITCIYLYRPGR